MKKRIYFVRHGESGGNLNKTHQTPHEPLTEKGLSQAGFIAQRVLKLPLDALIASSMLRAKQTAERIAQELKLQPEFSDLFVEASGPTQFMGRPHADPDAMEAYLQIHEKYGTPGWHFDDEENFDEENDRAKAALKFLEHRPEQNILVVTHGYFLRLLLSQVLFEHPTSAQVQKILLSSEMQNTGITVFDFDDSQELTSWGEKLSAWRLWVWNDHAHLG